MGVKDNIKNKNKIINIKYNTKNKTKNKINNKNKNSNKNKKIPYLLTLKKISTNFSKEISPDFLEFTKEFSGLSGSELLYEPHKWNDNYNIKSTHNCYTYALGKIRIGLDSKAQPGYASGYNHIDDEKDYNCNEFFKRLKKDVPSSYLEKFDNACLPGFYKIFLALDPGNDYHWWRLNSDGYWSHKPGATEVVDVDASGKKIKNPLLANRKYSSLNYNKPCFFACIYSDLSRSTSLIYGSKNKYY
jgi:hypothetical protein